MNNDLAWEKYNELVAALRERDKAALTLEACERRVRELYDVIGAKDAIKRKEKRISARDFRIGCNVI